MTCRQQNVVQVPTTNPFRGLLVCTTLALIIGASIVAGGPDFGAKKYKGDSGHPDVTLSVACVDPDGCDDETPSRLTDLQVTNGTLEGYVSDSEVIKEDSEEEPYVGDSEVIKEDTEEEPVLLEHSIDSYLTELEYSRTADNIRQSGFEIKASASPQPLLQQPYDAEASTTNFKYDYVEAWFKSLLMFEVQRGGTQV